MGEIVYNNLPKSLRAKRGNLEDCFGAYATCSDKINDVDETCLT
jgi:hypothetical protein